MTPAELIAQINQLGGRLYLDNGELRLKAPKGSLSDELRAELKARKQGLIDFIQAAQSAESSVATAIPRASRDDVLPASFSQQRLWFLDELEPGNSTYNMPWSLRLRGSLNNPALQAAIDDLVLRHESLHTRFASDGMSPVQIIDPALRTVLQTEKQIDASDAWIQHWLAEQSSLSFDLANGPLFRAYVLQTGDQDHRLLLVIHHIISDAWSMSVLFHELTQLYAAHCTATAATLPDLDIQYADYAIWQRNWLQGAELERQIGYWRNALVNAPPLLELPTDRPRPIKQSYAGDHIKISTSAEITRQLNHVAQAQSTSMFMVLQAAFNILLARYSGTDDIVIGTPIAGRRHAELEPLIGFFLNTLVLRTHLSGNPAFTELLERVRRTTLAAYEHQDLPFEKLVEELRPERELSHSPLFQVLFNLRTQADGAVGMHELEVDFDQVERATSKVDLALSIDESRQGLELEFEYNTDLFDRSTVEEMARAYITLLGAIVANPGKAIGSLTLLDPQDRQRRLAAEAAAHPATTMVEFPVKQTEQSIVERFEAQVAAGGDRLAVHTKAASWSYAELNGKANSVAEALIESHGDGPHRAGLLTGQDAPMLAGLLGILKAGMAYVPLDPEAPSARHRQICDEAGLSVVVTDGRHRAKAEAVAGSAINIVEIDPEKPGNPANPRIQIAPDALAYILFTSGSTGTPKGVMQSHRNVLHHCRTYTNALHLAQTDRLSLLPPYGFDAAVMDIFGALLNGASLYPYDLRNEADPGIITRSIADNRLSIFHSTPTVFRYLLELHGKQLNLESIRAVVLGGEEARGADFELFRKQFAADAVFVNGLGPSESTLALQYFARHDSRLPGQLVPVGRPVSDTEIILLDEQGMPNGISGELAIRSRYVTPGYWNAPDLTAAALSEPDNSGRRLYRTGDQARYLVDGQLVYIGRKDAQIKLRGHRIEAGEIEAVIAAHPSVDSCVVILGQNDQGTPQLVAYMTGHDGAHPDSADMRRYLREKLPAYMVPAGLVCLDELPLTPNGKVDRSALPKPAWEADASAYVAPRTPEERALTEIWQDVLKTDKVGIHDDFFALGGYSLLATQIVARVRKVMGRELPLSMLFRSPTIAGLANALDELLDQVTVAIPTADRSKHPRLSFQQQRLWFLDQLAPESSSYNISWAMRLTGELDVTALQVAFDTLVARHETLRTTFVQIDEEPVQIVAAELHIQLEQIEFGTTDEARTYLADRAFLPFNLTHGPLLRLSLVKLGDRDHVLMMTIHHIISDAWSINVLMQDLSQSYSQLRQGQPARLPRLAVQYIDYSSWQRQQLSGDSLEQQLSYWRNRLADLPQLLKLPTDRPRPPVQTEHGARMGWASNDATPKALKQLARTHGCTLYMLLLAAFDTLLCRYSGQTDIAVGTPIAGRQHTELEDLIGFFVNTLVIRADLADNPSFTDLLLQLKKNVLNDFAHQETPFEKLVDELQPARNLSHTPLFQVNFIMQNAPGEAWTLDNLEFADFPVAIRTAKFDLTLAVWETPEGLGGVFEYNTDLFDDATIERMVNHFKTLLAGIVADPNCRIHDLPLLGPAEQQKLLVDWNATHFDYPAELTVHAMFESQAARQPDAIALWADGEELSYAELNRRANRLAAALRSAGAQPGVLVGISIERTAHMITGLLGILKSGAAYVPLDPKYPADRVAFMLEDCGAPIVVSQSSVAVELPDTGAHIICLDSFDWGRANEQAANPASGARATDLAYVIYTSGSTGRPKGVAIEHRNTVALMQWAGDVFRPQELAGVLASTSVCFDLSVFEIFCTLGLGGRVVLVENALALPDLPADTGVTLINTVPSAIAELVRIGGIPASVRTVNLAGEPLTTTVADAIYAAASVANVNDLYGPSEDTTYSTWTRRNPGEAPTVGRPIHNTQVYLLDPWGHPAPTGAIGELYLGGSGVTRGYLNRPELTAEKFVPDNFGGSPDGRLYRTGDQARYRPDGKLEFLGRIDQQIKLRGFRIELGEIEAALDKLDLVEQSLVMVHEASPGNKKLIAYISQKDTPPDAADLRTRLQAELPEYMVPSTFIILEQFPLLPNGKIDRKALPDPEWQTDEEYVAPRTPTEKTLADIWASLLRLDRVGIHDNFFELGGDSILSIRIISRAAQKGLYLTTKQVFSHQNIAALADAISSGTRIAAEQGLVTGAVPLSPIQSWFLDFDSPNPDHFNQAMMLDIDPALSVQTVQLALHEVFRHHDALRLRFRRDDSGWVQDLDSSITLPELQVTSLADTSAEAREQKIAADAEATQMSIDTGAGCLLAARLFVTADNDANLLLLVVHHLGVDGVSWGILMEDIETACRQIAAGKPVQLPPKTTSFKAWTEKLKSYATAGNLNDEVDYWQTMIATAKALPVDNPDGGNTIADSRRLTVSLDEETTRQLLQEVPSAYQTRINDVLLTALARALRNWAGNDARLIDLEGHGREELFDDMDVSRTVGWFTSKFPVRLHMPAATDIGTELKAIKEQLRAIPNNGLGYGLLEQQGAIDLQGYRKPEIVFNYLGQFNQVQADAQLLTPSPIPAGPTSGADRARPHLLDINSRVVEDRLYIGLTYSSAIFDEASVEKFANEYRAELAAVIRHCVSPEAFGRTPSDFPLCTLDQAEVDRLTAHDRNVEDIYPATAMQHGILFHSIYEGDRDTYLSQVVWELDGIMDAAAFGKAWQVIVDRHIALRTGIVTTQAGQPLQVAYRNIDVPLVINDWSGLPEKERNQRLAEFIDHNGKQRFALAHPPLMRLNLFRYGDNDYRFVWSYHHIVIDGWSVHVIMADLMNAYHDLAAGQDVRLGELRSYRDYVEWLSQQEYSTAENFWRETLAGLTAPTALPAARISYNQALGQGTYSERSYGLSEQATDKLKEFARHNRLTPNTVLQGVWSILLSRYSTDEQIIFGATTSGRPAELKNVESMVGLLINALPIATQIRTEQPAAQWLATLQEQQLNARQHEFASLVEVQGWSDVPRGIPLFNTLLVFENYPKVSSDKPKAKDALAITGRQPIEWTNYPLTLVANIGNQLYMRFDFDQQYYGAETIDQIARHFLTLLESMIADPDCKVGALSMLDAEETQKLLVDWNNTQFDYPQDITVHSMFEKRAAEQPDAIALWCDGDEISYQELNRRANRLAAHLRELGVERGGLVGISIDRCAHMITGLLGILKAGAAYVPLDPKYPPERVAFMLDDSQAPVLLTQESLRDNLPERAAQLVCLDSFDWGSANDIAPDPVSHVQPDDLAYVIYTSGSTGLPKGVAIEHRNTVALIQWAGDVFAPEQFAGVLASTSVCFDLSVFEIFCTLGIGGRIVLVPNALALPDLPASANVTLINTVPSAVAELVRMKGIPATVATVNLAGEPLTTALADSIYEIGTVKDVNDLYGPSEDTTYSTWTRRIKGAPPTIGRPVHNTQVYLLDTLGGPVPVGVPGELYLGGAGVTRGYLNRPELTAEKYVPDPFSKNAGARLYRTGDRARYRPDSNIEFLGRLDHQVKLRGFRIELGEIETRIEEHAAVDKSLVIVREDTPGDQRLVAYLVAGTENLDRSQIEQWEAEQVAQWEDLWQNTYSDDKDVELGSDFSGWISSYTSEPIPVTEMSVWIDTTTRRINELRASRILEIGSGTGLVAARVAPECDHYLATDFSGAVIDTLEKLKESRDDLGSLELRQSRADELTDIQPGSYDAVIINSVAQYFPDVEYFVTVIKRSIEMLGDRGHIFLGDLRSLPLLDAYHSSVQLYKANDSLPVASLASRIRQRIDEEEELLIDPAIFAALAKEYPSITGVRFQLKRGHALNELTRFRYDVIIEIGGKQNSAADPEVIDWHAAHLSLAGLRSRLDEGRTGGLLIRNIPDARLVGDALAMERFVAAGDMDTATLRTEIAAANLQGVEPEAIYELMQEKGWDVQLLAGETGTFNALCRPATDYFNYDGFRLIAAHDGELHEYANDPLRGRLARSLEPLLRARIKANLPEYMMPSAFIIMDEFPLTPNGKIDRKKLPAPEWRPQKEYVAPRTPTEEVLAEIWSETLRVERVGIYDDFFALGGHSLLAMQLVSRIRDRLQAELQLVNLFKYPTIAAMANQVNDGPAQATEEITPCDRSQPLPMSYAQQRMWFLHVMEPQTYTYNVPWVTRLVGALNMPALQHALNMLVERHESLRTIFTDGDDSPVQVIVDSMPVKIAEYDYSGASDTDVRTKVNELWKAPFDLEHGPLLHLAVLHLDSDNCVLVLCMHHIICDNWSLGLLYREMASLYEAYRNDTPVILPRLPIQYADYTVWQSRHLAGAELDRQVSYWKQQLTAAPPLLNLPTDKIRPPVETHAGASEQLLLDKQLADALTAQARANGCTLFVLVLAAFNVLLHRYSGEDDIVVGTPISGRGRSELEGIIGFFLNTLAMRTDMSGNPNFSELLERTRQVTLDAFDHQDVPFEKLVEQLQPVRNLSHAPIFQVLFVLNTMSRNSMEFGNLEVRDTQWDFTGAKFDLQLTVTETQDGLAAAMLYNTDLFQRDSVRRMLDHFRILLESIAANPQQGINDLPIVGRAERDHVISDFNATAADYPVTSVVSLIEAQVTRTPATIAIRSARGSLSYAELNGRANRLARHLAQMNVGRGTLVGVCAERSPETAVAILAVLKTGAAYVPIDPHYPSERVAFMLDDSQAPVILTHTTLLNGLPQHTAVAVCLDEFDWDTGDDSNLQVGRTADDVVYAIYTSGSTGQPKGVLMHNLALANLLQWQQTQPRLSQPASTLQFASFSFDVSFQELFSTWQQGGTLVMIDEELRRDLPGLARFIAAEGIERLFLPYAALQPLVECVLNDGLESSLQVRDVIVAGEQLQITPAVRELFTKLGTAELHNHYGPSETHVVTAYTLQPDVTRWKSLPPIGQPVANTQVYVLDERRKPVPIGVPGELYIGGTQVALGYLRRAELTAEKFVANPFSNRVNARLYRTGDRVRFLADGNLEYLGRTDDQVKWRGFRIEPGEIETTLATHGQVLQAAVLLREDSPGDKRLVAYLVPDNDQLIDTAAIRSFAKDKLPEYMVPSLFVVLDTMPLTPSGKIARRLLPKPDSTDTSSSQGELPITLRQKTVTRIWEKLLKVDGIMLDDNFFDLGGHSLLTIKLIHAIEAATGEHVTIADVFENPTVREFAPLLTDAAWNEAAITPQNRLVRIWNFLRRAAGK